MNRKASRRTFLQASALVGSTLCGIASGSASPSWGLPSERMASPLEKEIVEIPTSVYKTRVANVQAELGKQDIGALVILSVLGWTSGYDSRYLAKQWPGIVLVPAAGDPTFIANDPIPPRPRIVETWMGDVRWARGWERMLEHCADRLKELGLGRGKIAIGGDFDWATKLKLETVLPGGHFEEGNSIQDQFRLIKDEYEIKFMRRAGQIADAQIHAAQRAIRPGRQVREVVADTLQAAYAIGASWRDSVELAGYSPEDSLRILGGSPEHRISSGEAFQVEPIPWYGHYNVETPVTFAVGKVLPEQKALADLCFEAFQAGVEKLKPGAPVVDAVKAAWTVIRPKGYTDFINGPGHFIGIGNIERPPIERDPGVVLKPGMTLSFHGNLVVQGKAKAIVGCCFLITETGKEAFTSIKLQPMLRA